MSWFKTESKKKLKSRIEELVAENKNLKSRIEELVDKNENLESKIEKLNNDLDEITSDINTTPEDCKRGEWCEACEFAKFYSITNNYHYSTKCTCGKAEVCKNFVERHEED